MPRLAAIDIGSNSVLLLIAELLPDAQIEVLVDTRRTVRLTSDPSNSFEIADEAQARLTAVLAEYSAVVNAHAVDLVSVGATQAFRAAKNGRQVCEAISRELGWEIKILSSSEEAGLSYLAAASGLEGLPEQRLVIDVGGGSSEIIQGLAAEIARSTSISLGAVGLSQAFALEGEADESALSSASDAVAQRLAEALPPQFEGDSCVLLVGGTATTLAALSLGAKKFDPNAIHGVKLETAWLGKQTWELAALDLAARRARLPFDPERAEIIVGGCLILKGILKRLEVAESIVSNRGLRWGLLLAAAQDRGLIR